MKIKENIYNYILNNISDRPPEEGGIIGTKKGVICRAVFDKGVESDKPCTYAPDVDRLNKIIEKWAEEDILFAGIFHTHFYGVETPSEGDIFYIKTIMKAVYPEIKLLYFPIILPEMKKIKNYKAMLKDNDIVIKADDLKIVN